MWLEAIFSREDLIQALSDLLPMRVQLDQEKDDSGEVKEDEPERSLALEAPTEVIMVPDRGLRVTCPAELTWSIAGVSPSMKIESLQVMILPEVVEKNKGHVLEFGMELEVADFRVLPTFLDETIVNAVNAALAAKKVSWNFTETLTRTVGLGTLFEPVEALKLEVVWGKTKIGDDTLGLVVSFKAGFVRTD